MERMSPHAIPLIRALLFAVAIGMLLFIIGVFRNGSFDYWYLPYNLLLGAIPLFLSFWLMYILNARRWKSWVALVATVAWVLFLPNSFYIVTDFIHLYESDRVDVVQDIAMIVQFSFVGMAAGFWSLLLVHRRLLQRMGRGAHLVVAGVLLLCGFAIYLGRELRWNSWDVVVQPYGLVTDVFAHLLAPQLWITTLGFFFSLGSLYIVLWQLRKLPRNSSL
jgi:uncharacterized membrane protein